MISSHLFTTRKCIHIAHVVPTVQAVGKCRVQVTIDTYVHLLHVYLDYTTIPTSEHALVHDTVPCQQHSITLHDTASSRYLDDVARNEIIRVNLNKLCQQTSHNINS